MGQYLNLKVKIIDFLSNNIIWIYWDLLFPMHLFFRCWLVGRSVGYLVSVCHNLLRFTKFTKIYIYNVVIEPFHKPVPLSSPELVWQLFWNNSADFPWAFSCTTHTEKKRFIRLAFLLLYIATIKTSTK